MLRPSRRRLPVEKPVDRCSGGTSKMRETRVIRHGIFPGGRRLSGCRVRHLLPVDVILPSVCRGLWASSCGSRVSTDQGYDPVTNSRIQERSCEKLGPKNARYWPSQTRNCLHLVAVLPDGPPARREATSWRVYLFWEARSALGLPMVGVKIFLPTSGRTDAVPSSRKGIHPTKWAPRA